MFSNWGNVSVAAPGLDVLSLRARRTDLMRGVDGTRYSAGAAYVGDDRRDVEAGLAAGMQTAVARWGYLNGGNAETWGANWIIGKPQDLLSIIDQTI